MTREEVDEIADAPAGVVTEAVDRARIGAGSGGGNVRDVTNIGKEADSMRMGMKGAMSSATPEVRGAGIPSRAQERGQPKLSVASVSKDGKVTFEAKSEKA